MGHRGKAMRRQAEAAVMCRKPRTRASSTGSWKCWKKRPQQPLGERGPADPVTSDFCSSEP